MAIIYQNNNQSANRHTTLHLSGSEYNRNAIGSKVYLFSNNEIITAEKFASRGFLSSMEMPMLIGTGKAPIDSAFIVWPDNTFQSIPWDTANTNIKVVWRSGLPKFNYSKVHDFSPAESMEFNNITARSGVAFLHEENVFNEYNREALLGKMLGNEGPALAVGDMNGDGLEDVYVGNAKWKTGALFMQTANGKFIKSLQPLLAIDSTYEDVDAVIVDVNNDQFPDLVIASGGNEFYGKEPWRQPRIYLNDGKGNLSVMSNPFPGIFSTQSCIKAGDFNADGFVDFFIGGRAIPFAYGKNANSFLMQNDGTGHFKDVTAMLGTGLATDGFITNAAWVDIDNDQQLDLVITKEWGKVEVYVNNKNSFTKKDVTQQKGWWNFVLPMDVDGDGDIDILAGNQGENNRVKVSATFPLQLYYNDFDDNGTKEQVITYFQKEKEIPLATKMDLEKQLPFIKKKFLYASDFANATLTELFGKAKLSTSQLYTADYFSNTVFINDGKGNFTPRALPWLAQLSSFRDAVEIDANGDQRPDILLGGNFYQQSMQLNRNDADFGTTLINKGNGDFIAEPLNGIVIKNEIRRIKPIKISGKPSFIIARNNDSLIVVQKR